MRYSLRTLVILLAILPPLLAFGWSLRPRPAPERVVIGGDGWQPAIRRMGPSLTPIRGTAISPAELNRELRRIYEESKRQAP